MKKIISLTAIVICISFATKAQDIVNLRMDRQQMGLRGRVASMDEDILLRKDYFRDDWPQRKWFVRDLRSVLREDEGRIVTFNPDGRMTTVTYTLQGKAGRKTQCSYASNGLLSSYVGEGYKVEAKYNGNYADINVYVETKDYKPLESLERADLNTTPYTNTYPFDMKCRQELTDDGLVLKSSYYYVDSMPAKVCEYNYNHNNLLTSEKTTDFSSGEKDVVVTRYNYDNQGFLIKKVIHGKSVDETWTYENNELGDCMQMTVERPYGTVVYTFDYVYDTVGNWTVRLQFQDGKFDNAALRTLTYHKESKAKKASKKEKSKANKKSGKETSSVKADKPVKEKKSKADKEADKAKAAAEKQAAKEAKVIEKEKAKAEQERIKELEKTMSKEEKKAFRAELKAKEKAEKERVAAEKKAEKERVAAEKKTEKEKSDAIKKAEKERLAAEKKAEKDKSDAVKKAEKERIAAEKKAEKEKADAEKKAAKERKAAEKKAKKK